MLRHPGGSLAALTLLLSALPAFAVDTHVWDQSDFGDFTRGVSKGLAIGSDGHVGLAPVFRELDSTSVPYLWALAKDNSSTLFYAGGAPTGATAKVFRLPPGGKPSVLAELQGLEIHALAVDGQNRVYAAVLPDAKIYRIDGSGKPQLFFDAHSKYIWAMAFDAAGNLFVATGDSGILYRVTPDGKGTKFFDSEETHVRSLLVRSSGEVIIGTEPSGLVLRIDQRGQGFVLYETNRREVTALAERDGLLYAASVGSKSSAAVVSGPSPALPANSAPVNPAGTPRPNTAAPAAAPALSSFSANVTGGSEVYRLRLDGDAERVWNSGTELVYALAFDPDGKLLVGTGNRGVIYRVDTEQRYTQLRTAAPTQITSFLPGPQGGVYVATGNVGNVYLLGPAREGKGTLTSEVLDARDFTLWGKAHLQGDTLAGVQLESRSGNVNNPENHWSPWATVPIGADGGQVPSPPARFLQYRLTLSGEPALSAVDIAYLPRNAAPRIRAVEVAPLNYRQSSSGSSLEASVNAAGSPATLTLPAVGQRRTPLPPGSVEGAGAATLHYSKGFATIRWAASDRNDDPLRFKVELAPKGSTHWQTLKDQLADHSYSFDTTAFPDGDYRARVTATDLPGNIASEALTGSLESDVFHVDNSAPVIDELQLANGEASFTAADAASWIAKAEYSIDGGEWTLLSPVNKVTDARRLQYRWKTAAGHALAVRVFDENDNVVVRRLDGR